MGTISRLMSSMRMFFHTLLPFTLSEREWLSEKSQLSFVKLTEGRFGKLLGHNKDHNDVSRRIIFRGWYNNYIEVAIERFELEIGDEKRKTEIERTQLVFKKLAIHENLVRYFCCETVSEENGLNKKELAFLAVELCLCSVADLFDIKNDKEIPQQEILSSLTAKEILYQATRGLAYLHQNGFVHRNVKPSSFLIKEVQSSQGVVSYAVKLTDFRLTRQLDPKKVGQFSQTLKPEGWGSPESKEGKELKHSSDVYLLGCFFHYVLTGMGEQNKPRHPFHDAPYGLMDIVIEDCEVYKSEWKPEGITDEDGIELIKGMIQFNESKRLTLTEVLQDKYFQPSKDDNTYPIYQANKTGLCVIFNQEKFPNHKKREGTEKDCAALEKNFKALGFEVQIHQDKTAFEIQVEVEALAKNKNGYKNFGCLVVCLLSHGDENVIFGSDGRRVNIYELQYLFSYKNCPTLYGKPKIFIVQACQGSLMQNKTGITFPKIALGIHKESVISNKSEWETLKESKDTGNTPKVDYFELSTILAFNNWPTGIAGTVVNQNDSCATLVKFEKEKSGNTSQSSGSNFQLITESRLHLPLDCDDPSIISGSHTRMTPVYYSKNVKKDEEEGTSSSDGNPPIMDLFTIKSTIPGFLSWRNSEKGSFFIQALCQKFQESRTNEFDLEDILRGDNGVQAIVNESLKKERQDIFDFLANNQLSDEKKMTYLNLAKHLYQTIRSEVSLSKRIKFRKNNEDNSKNKEN